MNNFNDEEVQKVLNAFVSAYEDSGLRYDVDLAKQAVSNLITSGKNFLELAAEYVEAVSPKSETNFNQKLRDKAAGTSSRDEKLDTYFGAKPTVDFESWDWDRIEKAIKNGLTNLDKDNKDNE